MNLSNTIISRLSPKRGRYCETSHVNHGGISSLRFNSFRLKSCWLFNSLPSNIINISSCSVLTSREELMFSSNPSQAIPWQHIDATVWIIFLVQRVVVSYSYGLTVKGAVEQTKVCVLWWYCHMCGDDTVICVVMILSYVWWWYCLMCCDDTVICVVMICSCWI